jgi:hypothetical protein
MVTRIVFLLAIVIGTLPSAVFAATPRGPGTSIYSGLLIPLGYCQIASLASSTNLLSSCAGSITAGSVPTLMWVVVEGSEPIRCRSDGTAPTTTAGMPLNVGASYVYAVGTSAGVGNLGTVNCIQETTGTTVDVEFFQSGY